MVGDWWRGVDWGGGQEQGRSKSRHFTVWYMCVFVLQCEG